MLVRNPKPEIHHTRFSQTKKDKQTKMEKKKKKYPRKNGAAWTFLINYYECFLGYLIVIFLKLKQCSFLY
jgi:hypothetical protein